MTVLFGFSLSIVRTEDRLKVGTRGNPGPRELVVSYSSTLFFTFKVSPGDPHYHSLLGEDEGGPVWKCLTNGTVTFYLVSSTGCVSLRGR